MALMDELMGLGRMVTATDQSWTIVVEVTLKACSTAFSSQSRAVRAVSSDKVCRQASCFSRTSCTCRSQLSTRPTRWQR